MSLLSNLKYQILYKCVLKQFWTEEKRSNFKWNRWESINQLKAIAIHAENLQYCWSKKKGWWQTTETK